MDQRPHLLVVSQVYTPDPAAVGQYISDAAEGAAARGWRVTVLTSRAGYDDPSLRFAARESIRGVDVVRLPWSSLGKRTILHRVVAQLAFCVQAILRGLAMRRLDAILVTTSPPMGGVVAVVVGFLRPGVAVHDWVMDINPDQALALGKVRPGSLAVRLLDGLNRVLLGRATSVVTLDPHMRATLLAKRPDAAPKVHVLPPWPMEEHLERVEHADNPFRREHGMEGRFVVMYSGNHSPAHSLATLLDAAALLADEPRVMFAFVGGGLAKREVEAFIAAGRSPHVLSLPYQPLERVKYSLSAADLHVVAMGPSMVGIIHPCKCYGAMALAKPLLLLGPSPCHVSTILDEHRCGWRVDHGDAAGLAALLRDLASRPEAELEAIGRRSLAAVEGGLSRPALLGAFLDRLTGR